MPLIWHIVSKDLRRSWPAILAWVLSAVVTVLIYSAPIEPELRSAHWMAFNGALFFLTTFFCYNAFVQLLLDDSLCDPGAFWVTRPISGWRLFSAKLLGCVFVSTFTLLVMIAVVTVRGRGIAHGYLVVQPTLVWLLFPCLAAFVAASVSRNTRQCLLVSALGCALIVGLLSALQNTRSSPAPTMDLHYARTMLAALLALAFSVAVVLNQFLTRNRARSIVAGVLGLVLTFIVAKKWPYSWPEPRLEPPQNAETFAGVQIAPVGVSPFNHAPHRLAVSFQADGLPPQVIPTALPSRHEWTLESAAKPVACWLEGNEPGLTRSLRMSDALRLPGQSGKPAIFGVHGVVPTDVFSGSITGYRAQVPIALWQSEITHEIPAKHGAGVREGPVQIEVADSTRLGSALEVSLAVPRETEDRKIAYAAINRRLNRCEFPSSWAHGSTPFAGVHRRRLTFQVKESDADFWTDATLVQVTFRRIAVIHREVALSKAELRVFEPRPDANGHE